MIRTIRTFFCVAPLLLPIAAGAAGNTVDGYDLTVRDAVEQALANNLDLKLQREDSDIAAGAVTIAESRFDSLLTAQLSTESEELTPFFTGGAEQEDTSLLGAALTKRFTTGTEVELGWNNSRFDSDSQGLLLDPAYTTGLSLDVSQPILRGWGKDIQLSSIKAAEKSFEASTFQVNSLAADLAAQVKTGYWSLVFAWQDIEVKKLSLTLAQKLLEETETKISAGKLAEVEVYQPQSEVALREESLIAAERAIGVADDELKLLLNIEDWVTPFTPINSPLTDPVELRQEDIFSNAIASRPDLRAADLEVEAAELRRVLAEDDIRPELNLIGSLGYGGTDDGYGDALGETLDDPDTRWLVGVNLVFPLDNSAARGALHQARAIHSQAKTRSQLLQLQIKRSVRTAVRDVRLAIKTMEASRKTSLATQKRLEAEQAKFDAGRSTTLDVLIAQEAYSEALSQHNQSSITYMQALAEIDRIQGLVTFPAVN